MQKFEIGKTYFTTSACDSNCVFTVKVLKRTDKTITAQVDDDKTKLLRILPSYDGVAEMVKPHGRYSMAPIVRADKVVK